MRVGLEALAGALRIEAQRVQAARDAAATQEVEQFKQAAKRAFRGTAAERRHGRA